MAKINLTRWDKLSKWTQNYYKRPMRYNIYEDKGVYTCCADYAAQGTAKGTGNSKAAAKAAAAETAWNQIESGEFIGDDFDVAIYAAWQQGEKTSSVDSMMKHIIKSAEELED